jgi:hypothetical protein
MKTDTLSKWLVPAVGFVIGLLMAAALLGQHASLWQAGLSFVIVAAYALVFGFCNPGATRPAFFRACLWTSAGSRSTTERSLWPPSSSP